MGTAELLTHVLLSSLVAVTLPSHCTQGPTNDFEVLLWDPIFWAGATRCYQIQSDGLYQAWNSPGAIMVKVLRSVM